MQSQPKLFFGNCLYRATGSASTAAAAFIRVNLVMLGTLGDSVAGAAGSASTAADAGIGNLISHQKHLHSMFARYDG